MTSACEVTSVVSDSVWPYGLQPSRLLSLLPGDFPNSGIEPTSFKSPALAGGFFTTSTILEALFEQMTTVVYNFDYDQSMRVEDILILI